MYVCMYVIFYILFVRKILGDPFDPSNPYDDDRSIDYYVARVGIVKLSPGELWRLFLNIYR